MVFAAEAISKYRKAKGIRRPFRFYSKPESWDGNLFDIYGIILRGQVRTRT